ncbi:N-acetylglucosaminyl-phosphatidylinositol de-N-acetylase [Pseudolycoriella hygida]|uniref:N-acetylglucosaminylphosphatidylinositol deacetylase n=1 Tax=Pseudolycoriella hygida TaxID=35572 RepID=A0A9Q0MM42_9DIPT|nr:N-acetylglucosaminyl-phosphatidylinositol de-N-acetylase [Pseudolycoriella hygida]
MNETIVDIAKYSLFDRELISAYKSYIYLLIVGNIKEALDHLILVVLAYSLICIVTYQMIFRRFINRFHLISDVRLANFRRVLIVTAHPDDECMFFGPTILSLTQRSEPCTVYLLCLSNGNFEQKGNIRKQELYDATKVLSLKDEHITLMNSTLLVDDPNLNWKTELVAKQIQKEVESLDIEALITFDRDGVSCHPNHCAIYYAAASLRLAGYLPKSCKILTLDSVNILRKYMSVFDLVISLLLSTNWCILSWKNVNIVRRAMRQHKSQMLWFRKLYIIFSRYMVINTLREVNVSDIELDMQINDT